MIIGEIAAGIFVTVLLIALILIATFGIIALMFQDTYTFMAIDKRIADFIEREDNE